MNHLEKVTYDNNINNFFTLLGKFKILPNLQGRNVTDLTSNDHLHEHLIKIFDSILKAQKLEPEDRKSIKIKLQELEPKDDTSPASIIFKEFLVILLSHVETAHPKKEISDRDEDSFIDDGQLAQEHPEKHDQTPLELDPQVDASDLAEKEITIPKAVLESVAAKKTDLYKRNKLPNESSQSTWLILGGIIAGIAITTLFNKVLLPNFPGSGLMANPSNDEPIFCQLPSWMNPIYNETYCAKQNQPMFAEIEKIFNDKSSKNLECLKNLDQKELFIDREQKRFASIVKEFEANNTLLNISKNTLEAKNTELEALLAEYSANSNGLNHPRFHDIIRKRLLSDTVLYIKEEIGLLGLVDEMANMGEPNPETDRIVVEIIKKYIKNTDTVIQSRTLNILFSWYKNKKYSFNEELQLHHLLPAARIIHEDAMVRLQGLIYRALDQQILAHEDLKNFIILSTEASSSKTHNDFFDHLILNWCVAKGDINCGLLVSRKLFESQQLNRGYEITNQMLAKYKDYPGLDAVTGYENTQANLIEGILNLAQHFLDDVKIQPNPAVDILTNLLKSSQEFKEKHDILNKTVSIIDKLLSKEEYIKAESLTIKIIDLIDTWEKLDDITLNTIILKSITFLNKLIENKEFKSFKMISLKLLNMKLHNSDLTESLFNSILIKVCEGVDTILKVDNIYQIDNINQIENTLDITSKLFDYLNTYKLNTVKIDDSTKNKIVNINLISIKKMFKCTLFDLGFKRMRLMIPHLDLNDIRQKNRCHTMIKSLVLTKTDVYSEYWNFLTTLDSSKVSHEYINTINNDILDKIKILVNSEGVDSTAIITSYLTSVDRELSEKLNLLKDNKMNDRLIEIMKSIVIKGFNINYIKDNEHLFKELIAIKSFEAYLKGPEIWLSLLTNEISKYKMDFDDSFKKILNMLKKIANVKIDNPGLGPLHEAQISQAANIIQNLINHWKNTSENLAAYTEILTKLKPKEVMTLPQDVLKEYYESESPQDCKVLSEFLFASNNHRQLIVFSNDLSDRKTLSNKEIVLIKTSTWVSNIPVFNRVLPQPMGIAHKLSRYNEYNPTHDTQFILNWQSTANTIVSWLTWGKASIFDIGTDSNLAKQVLGLNNCNKVAELFIRNKGDIGKIDDALWFNLIAIARKNLNDKNHLVFPQAIRLTNLILNSTASNQPFNSFAFSILPQTEKDFYNWISKFPDREIAIEEYVRLHLSMLQKNKSPSLHLLKTVITDVWKINLGTLDTLLKIEKFYVSRSDDTLTDVINSKQIATKLLKMFLTNSNRIQTNRLTVFNSYKDRFIGIEAVLVQNILQSLLT